MNMTVGFSSDTLHIVVIEKDETTCSNYKTHELTALLRGYF